MKWETVTSTIGHSAYALWNNGRKLVTLAFNPLSNAARIEYENEKRVYLIRREGFLKNKLVLCNEYGVRLAHTASENKASFIVLNNQRYFYDFDNEREPALTFYKGSRDQPLAVCTMSIDDIDRSLWAKKFPLKDTAAYTLILLMCFYLFNTR